MNKKIEVNLPSLFLHSEDALSDQLDTEDELRISPKYGISIEFVSHIIPDKTLTTFLSVLVKGMSFLLFRFCFLLLFSLFFIFCNKRKQIS